MLTDQRIVQLRSDGLALSPVAYAALLARLAETGGIAPNDYSRGGVVEELEARMAALLGKEAAVFMPSGTLANHLALRLLARGGRRVLVQRESHLYNDEGDCAQQLSGLTLVPLELYFKKGHAKVALALGKGKKQHDKREALKRRIAERETARAVSIKGRR